MPVDPATAEDLVKNRGNISASAGPSGKGLVRLELSVEVDGRLGVSPKVGSGVALAARIVAARALEMQSGRELYVFPSSLFDANTSPAPAPSATSPRPAAPDAVPKTVQKSGADASDSPAQDRRTNAKHQALYHALKVPKNAVAGAVQKSVGGLTCTLTNAGAKNVHNCVLRMDNADPAAIYAALNMQGKKTAGPESTIYTKKSGFLTCTRTERGQAISHACQMSQSLD